MRDLSRLLAPRRLAVVGGGAWGAGIVDAARRIGFVGEILPVHPGGKPIGDIPAVARLEDIDGPVDAAFIGINREATIDTVRLLRELGAGGAVCFASGFSEAVAEDAAGSGLQAQLVQAAGDMPILGPNCYGFVNALDRVAIWPDQHGMQPVDRGVAILTQSSNIAINLTMQKRGLPLAMMVACGNQAQTRQPEVALALLDDPRITAIGLHIEGFGDIAAWHALALKAHEKNVPLIAIKVGASDQARQATVSHTASLAGDDAGAAALLERLGIGRAHDLPCFVETLKLAHMEGRLDSPTLSSISCSGGEASLSADAALAAGMDLPALTETQKTKLREALGPRVALANPLDYHTYIWRDADAMTAVWRAMAAPHVGLSIAIVDYPHTDATDWACATEAALRVRAETGRPFVMAATLGELMPEHIAQQLMAGGVVPIQGLTEAVGAASILSRMRPPDPEPPLAGGTLAAAETLNEAEAKFALSGHDLDLPRRAEADLGTLVHAARNLMAPLALKGMGLAHKTEAGAVRLGLSNDQLQDAAQAMPAERFLVEEMVEGGVAELLIGVTRDPAHGLLLTIGAGGVLAEVLEDTATLLMPVTEEMVDRAIRRLRIARVLDGYRGKPAASRSAIIAAIMAVQRYVMAEAETVLEVEINPLICTPTRAVAVDALIRKGTRMASENRL